MGTPNPATTPIFNVLLAAGVDVLVEAQEATSEANKAIASNTAMERRLILTSCYLFGER
jgi:hypothetical protein